MMLCVRFTELLKIHGHVKSSPLIFHIPCLIMRSLWSITWSLVFISIPVIECSSFISLWDTMDSYSIELPLESTGTYAMWVDWGDNSADYIDEYDQDLFTHIYAANGQYNIIINGTLNGFAFGEDNPNAEKLLNISQWGSLQLGNSGAYFDGCVNLQVQTPDALDLTGLDNAWAFFRSCHMFNGHYAHLYSTRLT